MIAIENTMGNKNKTIDALPESFESAEAAGEFWDTHSIEDYAEYFEPVDDTFEIKSRVYEVQISEAVYKRLKEEAHSSHEPVGKIVDRILKKELAAA